MFWAGRGSGTVQYKDDMWSQQGVGGQGRINTGHYPVSRTYVIVGQGGNYMCLKAASRLWLLAW